LKLRFAQFLNDDLSAGNEENKRFSGALDVSWSLLFRPCQVKVLDRTQIGVSSVMVALDAEMK
jgi:hypothetical protein